MLFRSGPELPDLSDFLAIEGSWMIVLDLLGVAIAGGMFVVPLYAFLTMPIIGVG